MNERIPLMRSVFSDEAFVNACIEAENEEAVQKLFADKGVEMSLTEIELMKEMVCAVGEGKITEEQLETLANGGELSEDELADAAGGNIIDTFFNYFTSSGMPIDGDQYREYIAAGCNSTRSLSGAGWGAAIVGGLVVAGGAAYGICKACGVDVEGGIKSAYNWVADKVTSRW